MFICMQKINFISHSFFEILQTHFKVAILETLGMLDHPIKNHTTNWQETFMLSFMQKINFITHFFLSCYFG